MKEDFLQLLLIWILGQKSIVLTHYVCFLQGYEQQTQETPNDHGQEPIFSEKSEKCPFRADFGGFAVGLFLIKREIGETVSQGIFL